ncbi:hydrophobic seed protein-like [Vigna umbellata]|uniref:hydrophobic seed protein-like n=1 Tax=Vigna umbellata TaxID=87088 RepID=UPI001F5F866C|nr:hydrophobic seed protein-like [Vigna umbellata]
MGSKSVAFLLSLNLLLFSALSCNTPKCVSSPPPVKCPKLHICASILVPPYKPDPNCCPLLGGLIDLEAVVCLCAVLKLDLGIIKVDLDILLNLLLNTCGRQTTTYTCPP